MQDQNTQNVQSYELAELEIVTSLLQGLKTSALEQYKNINTLFHQGIRYALVNQNLTVLQDLIGTLEVVPTLSKYTAKVKTACVVFTGAERLENGKYDDDDSSYLYFKKGTLRYRKGIFRDIGFKSYSTLKDVFFDDFSIEKEIVKKDFQSHCKGLHKTLQSQLEKGVFYAHSREEVTYLLDVLIRISEGEYAEEYKIDAMRTCMAQVAKINGKPKDIKII